MKLPGAVRAVVEIEKLRDYCLSTTHPRGKHKAMVFASALRVTADDAEILRDQILSAALYNEAISTEKDKYGQRYIIDFEMENRGRKASIRTSWIIRVNEDFPRLTSCYVL
ncbi:MAG: DUF6883 domain-containing protein [Anaerolineales bacterium]